MYNIPESPAASKLSPDGTQHSEWHHVTLSMVKLIVHTALNTSVYAKMLCSNLTFGEVLQKVSYLRYTACLRQCFSNSM